MENASKALIMAGSILLSILIIGTVAFMHNKISTVEQARINAEDLEKISDYSAKFEAFNKQIYGSELLSLMNLLEDYNRKLTTGSLSQGIGYEDVKIYVDNKIITEYVKDVKGFENDLEKMEKEGKQNTEEYELLKSRYIEFKNTKFKCIKVTNGNTGSVKEMKFEKVNQM